MEKILKVGNLNNIKAADFFVGDVCLLATEDSYIVRIEMPFYSKEGALKVFDAVTKICES